jgi:hypothetical protein
MASQLFLYKSRHTVCLEIRQLSPLLPSFLSNILDNTSISFPSQKKNANKELEQVVTIVGKAIERRFNDTINEIKLFSQYVSSYVNERQQPPGGNGTVIAGSWPYVSIPAFDVISSNLLRLIRSNHVSLIPLVEPDEIWAWSSYATINQGWTLSVLAKSTINSSPGDDASSNRHGLEFIPNDIYELNNDDDNDDGIVVVTPDDVNSTTTYPVAPVWQTNALPSLGDVNFNTLSLPCMQQLFDIMQLTSDKLTVAFGPTIDKNGTNEHWIPSLQNRKNGSRNAMWTRNVTSVIVSPVLQERRQTTRPGTSNKKTLSKERIVAFLAFDFQWTNLFSDLMELQYVEKSILLNLTSYCSDGKDTKNFFFRKFDGYQLEKLKTNDFSSGCSRDISYHIEFDKIIMESVPKQVMCSYSMTIYATQADTKSV